jgi:hypothetical protein
MANEGVSDNKDSEEDDGNPERRTFCPAVYRDAIINMMDVLPKVRSIIDRIRSLLGTRV